MSIANPVTSLFPGFGQATTYVTSTAQNLPGGATTTFTLAVPTNYVRSGRLRWKSTVAGTGVISGVTITGTDGTTTVQLKPAGFAAQASVLFDYVTDFISDLNLTSITFSIVNGAGTASTLDFELAGNP